jgi:flagellar basal-body rod protein FlgF
MDNVMYVGLSRQETLQRELGVVANNVANVDTAGFKVESLMVQTDTEHLPAAADGQAPPNVNFVLDAGVARDFGQGALKQTGGALNLAVEGDGFFRVTTPAGERYTRDGRFGMDAQGRLVTSTGAAVQGDGGDVVLDPQKSEPKIAPDGTVSQDGQIVARISVVTFSSLSALAKDGDGLYRNVSNIQPQTADSARVRQGMLETSNVEPITQITRLIEITRAYESISQMVSQTGDLSSQAINRLGHVS